MLGQIEAIITGVTTAVASLANAGVGVYSTVEMGKLQKKGLKLKKEIAMKQLEMQEKANKLQYEIQKELAKAQAKQMKAGTEIAREYLRQAQMEQVQKTDFTKKLLIFGGIGGVLLLGIYLLRKKKK